MQVACFRALVAGGALILATAGGLPAADNLDGEIKLGLVNVQTGPAASLGKGMRAGAEAVFKEVNAKGGVHGRRITLVVADDGYEPERAVDETLKMIEERKVFSLFGFVGTRRPTRSFDVRSSTCRWCLFTGALTLRPPVPSGLTFSPLRRRSGDVVAHFLAKGLKTWPCSTGRRLRPCVLSGRQGPQARDRRCRARHLPSQHDCHQNRTGGHARRQADAVGMLAP